MPVFSLLLTMFLSLTQKAKAADGDPRGSGLAGSGLISAGIGIPMSISGSMLYNAGYEAGLPENQGEQFANPGFVMFSGFLLMSGGIAGTAYGVPALLVGNQLMIGPSGATTVLL